MLSDYNKKENQNKKGKSNTMNTKKTAYYQIYDPSVLDMTEYCIRQDICDDIANLEDDMFEFGKDMIKLSKNLDNLYKQEIVAKIQAIVDKHCGDYLEDNDSIENLDKYEGLKEYEDDEDESDEEFDEDESEYNEDKDDFESYDTNGDLVND